MVPLQTMTAFSLLRSPMTPQQLIKAAQEKGYQAVALTDYNVLYGMYDFYQAAKKAGMQPILGLTAELVGMQSSQTYPIVFLVENQIGYHNLLQISSVINTQDDQPTLTDLKPYLAGLYIILPSMGELTVVLGTEPDRATNLVEKVISLTDAAHVFLGISLNMREDTMQSMKELADHTGTRIVANETV